MKNCWLWMTICFAMCAFASAPVSVAQQDSKEERKLVTRVEPDYPNVLRKNHGLGGLQSLPVKLPKNNSWADTDYFVCRILRPWVGCMGRAFLG